MPDAPAPSAYRRTAAARTLVLEIRHPRTSATVATVLGLFLMTAACWFWFQGAHADVVLMVAPRRDLLGAEASSRPTESVERHDSGPLTLSRINEAWANGGHARVTWEPRWEPPALFLLALLAFFAPRLARESATLVLDEREERVSILRWSLGTLVRLDRPLRTLQEAVLVSGPRSSSAQLVFSNDERIDVAAPFSDAAAQARLVSAINDFVTRRRS